MSNDDIRRQLGAGQGECLQERGMTIERSGIYAPLAEVARIVPATPWAGVVASLAEPALKPG